MDNWTLFSVAVGALLIQLVGVMVSAVLERRTARQFLEGLNLVRPVMEDMRRIEPHLDESIELALLQIEDSEEKLRRIANGYVTPIGIVRARRRRK